MNASYPIFLSVVVVTKNQATNLAHLLGDVSTRLQALVVDHELIVIDNASSDDSILTLKRLTGEQGLPNLQVYALTKEVDDLTASWAGLENALGDFVAVLDPVADDPAFLDDMLKEALLGADVVFARNTVMPRRSLVYRVALNAFNGCYRRLGGIDLVREAPQFRVLSKRVINFVLQHAQPAVAYRHLPASSGFARANLTYTTPNAGQRTRTLGRSIDLAMRLMVSTTQVPMRVVMSLSMFAAFANLMYSVYVIGVAILKTDVAPGWITLSLQQSGMFFLLSLVLLVLSEYILQMASLSNEGPSYHVAQEFTSARITRREKLNIEECQGGGLKAGMGVRNGNALHGVAGLRRHE
ncbi:MAG: glycosyltransferase [Leptothrix sp. (in: b-proteobacteria)]